MTGPGPSLAGLLRIAAQLAAIYAEVLARRQEQAAQLQAAQRTAEAEQLRARLVAERDAARALVAPATVPGWWTTASPEQIARTWEVAAAWSTSDPQLAARAALIEAEVHTRYGTDPRVLLEQAQAARQPTPAGQEGTRAQAETETEAVEAGAVLAADDRAARAEAVTRAADRPRPQPVIGEDFPGFDPAPDPGTVDLLALWDTSGARAERAGRARQAAGADVDAAEAVITADQSQGTPPTAAVHRTPAPAKRARQARPARGAEVQAGR